MDVDNRLGQVKSWKNMPSSITEIIKNIFKDFTSNFAFLSQFGAGPKYFSTSVILHFINTSLGGLGIALLIPIAQGLISHDFQTLFTNKNFGLIFNNLPFLKTLDETAILFVLIGFILLTMILRTLLDYFSGLYQTKKEQTIVNNVSKYVFEKYLGFGLKFYDQTSAAKNQMNLVRTPKTFLSTLNTINGTLLLIIECTMLTGLIFILSPLFGLFALVIIPIYVIMMKFFNERIKKLMQEDELEELEEGSNNMDYIYRIPLTKAVGAENLERKRYHSMISRQMDRKLKMIKLLSLRTPMNEIITIIILFIFIFALAYSTSDVTNPDNLPVYLVIFFTFQQLLKKANTLSTKALMLSVSLSRLNTTISEFGSDDDFNISSGSKDLEPKIKSINFKELTFSYDGKKNVLDSLSLNIKKKEHIMILGKNGTGKSTLMSLLLRFYECPKNSIFINGHDVHDLSIDSIRKNISYISQDTCVFRDTLRNNILYGLDFKLTENEWNDLLKRADLETLVEKLPNGLDTKIGERGSTLSGGEKQRIAIARSLLRDAPIVIMDEPTSALDIFAENKFNSNVIHSFKEKIVIVITHRPKLAKHFDTIAVLDNGKLAEYGTFKELEKTCGFLSN